MQTPDAALHTIAAIVRDIHPGPEADWFVQGVSDYLNGESDLESALGLKGSGRLGNRAARRRIGNRNATLRQCLTLIPGSDWQRCVILAERINRLDRIRDPGELERLLLSARMACELPTTPEGIMRATRQTDLYP